VRYAFIRQERGNYPIRPLCRAMQVSVSGFYHWLERPPSARSIEQLHVVTAIRVAHARGRGFYGPKKLRDELLDDGLDVGINRIRRLRRKHGIYCLQKKRFRTTTESKHRYPVAPNLLGQCFTSTCPGEVWVADITYVDTGEGWLYVQTGVEI
jgi:putative transposase